MISTGFPQGTEKSKNQKSDRLLPTCARRGGQEAVSGSKETKGGRDFSPGEGLKTMVNNVIRPSN